MTKAKIMKNEIKTFVATAKELIKVAADLLPENQWNNITPNCRVWRGQKDSYSVQTGTQFHEEVIEYAHYSDTLSFKPENNPEDFQKAIVWMQEGMSEIEVRKAIYEHDTQALIQEEIKTTERKLKKLKAQMN